MANQAEIKIRHAPGLWPMERSLITKQGNNILKDEKKVLNSKADLDTLLEEVKQFNLEPGNQEQGITQIIS